MSIHSMNSPKRSNIKGPRWFVMWESTSGPQYWQVESYDSRESAHDRAIMIADTLARGASVLVTQVIEEVARPPAQAIWVAPTNKDEHDVRTP